MTRDLVSVIVPTYNRADCIGETLKTLLAQTYPHWELLLVDDGSTDDTRNRVTELFGDDARLKYIFQENAGVSHARNTGLAHAGGKFIAFLDSDDRWMPWKLTAQLACMRAFPEVGMVWTDMETIAPDGALLSTRHLRTMYSAYRFHKLDTLFTSHTNASTVPEMPEAALQGGTVFHHGEIFSAMIRGSLVHTSTVLLRRERALQVGGFDESLKHSGEDYDFHLRTCQHGPVGLLDVAAIQYRKDREDRLTRHTAATALNFLATVQKAVAADGAGRLQRSAVRQTLAEAHSWVAEEHFKLGDSPAVRRHVMRSLVRKPRNGRGFALLLISLVPGSLSRRAAGFYRAIKSRIRGNR